jgi:hypothetical protein
MIAEALFVLLSGMPAAPVSCPVPATAALPELIGRWNVIMLGNLDRSRPDSMRAESTISPDLQDCVLQERLRARTGTPPYEAIMFWGTNGADSAIQRTLVHSQHGRFGVYQGRRAGVELTLRQQNLGTVSQPGGVIVEHVVRITDRDHFTITSQLSNDRGRSWTALSRSEYQRAP